MSLFQAAKYVVTLNLVALANELKKQRDFPAGWAPMEPLSNSQLFEVDLGSPELMQVLQPTAAKIVKVCSSSLPCWEAHSNYNSCLTVYQPLHQGVNATIVYRLSQMSSNILSCNKSDGMTASTAPLSLNDIQVVTASSSTAFFATTVTPVPCQHYISCLLRQS